MSTVVPVPARIDTFAFAIPITDFDSRGCRVTIEHADMPSETFKYSRRLDGGGMVNTGMGDKAWIEASLPKRVDGENWEALLVHDALDVARDLLSESLEYLELAPGARFDDAKLVRLDLVRDFHDVHDPTPILDGLAGVEQAGRAKVRRFADPSANRAETIRVGPKAWGVTLYDKHVETGGKAPAGQLRCEARLHHAQLTSKFQKSAGGCFDTVADLIRDAGTAHRSEVYWLGAHHVGPRRDIARTSDGGTALARAQRAWFDRVGFGLTVDGLNQAAGLIRSSGLSNARQGTLWAYLTLPGFAASMHRNQRRTYRNLALDLGFAPTFIDQDDIPDIAHPRTRQPIRLDYDSGTAIAA